MAKLGILPKELANVPIPMCASCQFGKATKKPWRTKGPPGQASKLVPIDKPGDCVSVDQLESPTPGFIGQIKGRLTTDRYSCATVFVDHFSRLSFVHLQRTTSGEETLQAKKAFEAFSRSQGIRIKHYHADNGRFADKLFMTHVESS